LEFANEDIKAADHSEEWKVNCIEWIVHFLNKLSYKWSNGHLRVMSPKWTRNHISRDVLISDIEEMKAYLKIWLL